MKKKYEGWLDFLVQNASKCMPGTATEVSQCIAKLADEENFMPDNKSKEAKIRQLLPEHTQGMFKSTTKNRVLKSKTFININGMYDLPANYMPPVIQLNVDKKLKLNNNEKGECISIETPKDKSIDHNHLLNLIKEYVDEKGILAEVEHDIGIDLLLSLNDDKYVINEVKTYKNSIYVAVGQVQFYKHNLIQKFKLKKDQISGMNIIGNFDLPDRFKSFLDSLKISYIKISENKIPNNIFK